jgi:2-C-methyl-D-erythritol 2,4-cyclodiphosphate synthase
MRIGLGYDVHALVVGRRLILGGVEIPFERGLAGHSDADVLAHAIADALLGALREGDIGQHFPDTDPCYKDADSLVLLEQVAQLVRDKGWQIHDIDAVVIAQEPKLAPYREDMRARLSQTLGIAPDALGLKATTTEGLGFTGRGEGIAAQAVVLLEPCTCCAAR